VEAKVIIDSSGLSLTGAAALVEMLGSYQMTYSATFTGQSGAGTPADWQVWTSTLKSADPAARRIDVVATGLGETVGLGSLSQAIVAGQGYMAVPGAGCLAVPAAEVDFRLSGAGNLDSYLAGLHGARLVAEGEVVDNVATDHYVFDESALPVWGGAPVEADGHLYLDQATGALVHMLLSVKGEADFAFRSAADNGTLVLEAIAVNQAVIVSPPPGCGEASAFPALPDAYAVTNLEGLVNYKTAQPLESIVAFYQSQMAAAGWQLAEAATDGSTMIFQQGDRRVTIVVEPDPAAAASNVLLVED
jgi:hypothetical protein